MSTEPESPKHRPRRRLSPEPPIEQNIKPAGGLEGVVDEVMTERIQRDRDHYHHREKVGRDRLISALIGVVLLIGAGAMFADRLEAETFLFTCFAGLLGYFVRGNGADK